MSQPQEATCLVTVTYGNRGDLVVKVLESAIGIGVDKVVVIDNGATPESLEKIRAYAHFFEGRIYVFSLGTNTGSAGGFKRGVEEAYKTKAGFIWMLDDDNMPDSDALRNLQTAHRLLGSDPKIVLCSYREDRLAYFRAVEYGEVPAVRRNSFLDFDFFQKLKNLVSRKAKAALKATTTHHAFPLVQTKLAPYGGLYFKRDWVDLVGVPDERLFLYGDDHEYTCRMQDAGAVIYLCANSRIKDIDPSWSEGVSKVPSWVSRDSDERRVFYAIRNRVILEERFVSNPFVYFVNMYLYLSIISIIALSRYKSFTFLSRRIGLILRAVRFGLQSRTAGQPLGAYQSRV